MILELFVTGFPLTPVFASMERMATLHPVRIENDAVRIEVWPGFGGKVSSILDKADNYEMLFSYPTEIPTTPMYDIPYPRGWCAGWDECIPAVAPSAYVGHPYDGIQVPDHGEIWGLPATTAVPTKDGITTVWNGLRFGYRLSRKLSLVGSSILAEYSLVNLAPFEFRFVWAMHALFALDQDVEIDLGDLPMRGSHTHTGEPLNEEFFWSDEHPYRKPRALPKDLGWKMFSKSKIPAPARVRYPNRGRTLTITYQSAELPAYWGIWINSGGWGHHHHFAIEPCTGTFDQIDKCIRENTAARVPSGGRVDWNVRLELGNS